MADGGSGVLGGIRLWVRRSRGGVEFGQRLPSQPTMSRRLRRGSIEQLLAEVEQALLALVLVVGPRLLVIDGKAQCGRWAQQRCGRGLGPWRGGFAKGYKLHAIWGEGPLPLAWALTALNVSERRLAATLVRGLPGAGYLLGDKQYDVNYLYDAAAEAEYQLLARPQRVGKGLGHRRHSPHRLRGLELLHTSFGKDLYRRRGRIEHCFAQLTSFRGLTDGVSWQRYWGVAVSSRRSFTFSRSISTCLSSASRSMRTRSRIFSLDDLIVSADLRTSSRLPARFSISRIALSIVSKSTCWAAD